MPISENPTGALEGRYRDVLRGRDGRVLWDRGWRKNAIVVTCRHLLAGFLKGDSVLGIDGLAVGAGSAAWDASAPPPPLPSQSALVDPSPFRIDRTSPPPGASFQIDYLDGGNVVAGPTNRLQIAVTLGPGVPAWPDGSHTTSSLREFGLLGRIGGTDVLLNYVTHPVITKDPFSTLERTVWLVF